MGKVMLGSKGVPPHLLVGQMAQSVLPQGRYGNIISHNYPGICRV